VARFIHDLGLDEIDYNARLIEGVSADAIAGLVEQAKPDLLVIGTRGLSGVKRLFLGSVAQELMGSLECRPSYDRPRVNAGSSLRYRESSTAT
jgi:universal stress protein E